jgi:predicted transcriptional regulator|tara:strand:- start:599 stop:802 length:204 start_codon:yes stop_codon:yes gene_type:complete
MIQVEGHKDLFRDEKTGAILDTNTNSYSSYISRKNKKLDEKAELDNMKKDIQEIKELLKQITGQITS